MKVNNLYFTVDHHKNVSFFWLNHETKRLLDVYSGKNIEYTKEFKIVEEIKIPSGKLFQMEDFEMDPEGSELIVIPIKFNDNKIKPYEIMIFQEDRNHNIQMLTSLSEILMKQFSLRDVDIEDPVFINHPTINLKYISEKAAIDINKAKYNIRSYLSINGEDLKKLFTTSSTVSQRGMSDIMRLQIYTELYERIKRERINFDNPTYYKLGD